MDPDWSRVDEDGVERGLRAESEVVDPELDPGVDDMLGLLLGTGVRRMPIEESGVVDEPGFPEYEPGVGDVVLACESEVDCAGSAVTTRAAAQLLANVIQRFMETSLATTPRTSSANTMPAGVRFV